MEIDSEISRLPLISVVIPAYNEQGVLQISIPRIITCLNEILEIGSKKQEFEIVIVNDGSTDETEAEVLSLKSKLRGIRLIRLTVNAGHMRALEVGLSEARGSYILSLDADLQDPPEYIPKLYELIRTSESECVQTFRFDRTSDTFMKKATASAFYWLFRKTAGAEIVPHAADYRILTSKARDKILNSNKKDKVFRFLIPILGIATKTLPIHRDKRVSGASKYHLKDMAKLATYSLVNYTQILKKTSQTILFASFAVFSISLLMLNMEDTSVILESFGVTKASLTILLMLGTLSSSVLYIFDKAYAKRVQSECDYVEVD
jgi:glycosyltransferase involved in cell wall biosynthesis